MVCLGIAAWVGGCAANTREAWKASAGQSTLAYGDWDDLNAVVELAANQAGMAIVGTAAMHLQPADTVDVPTRRKSFELLTDGDEPAKLTFISQTTADPGELLVRARVGRQGDADRERELLAKVKTRLGELAGVDTAKAR